jgi:proteasome lid subunit RPN8/RPN11
VSAPVYIATAACDAIARHAAEAWPEECCGLLIADGPAIVEAAPARNIAAEPRRRFQIDPADHFAAIRASRLAGRRVVGAYHSHPMGEPQPSPTDLAEAFDDPDFIHVIVRPRAQTGEEGAERIAAYRLTTGNFVAVPLVTVP